MTTREKIGALVAEVRTMPLAEMSGASRDIAELLLIVQGFGFDPLGMLLPASDAEADELVDQLITLALQVRGDDLAPYDFDRHVRDSTATDA